MELDVTGDALVRSGSRVAGAVLAAVAVLGAGG